MTFETLDRANEITDILHYISEDEKSLSAIEKSCADEYYFSNGNYRVHIDRKLGKKLIPIIREYYQEQVKKLVKEFEKL